MFLKKGKGSWIRLILSLTAMFALLAVAFILLVFAALEYKFLALIAIALLLFIAWYWRDREKKEWYGGRVDIG